MFDIDLVHPATHYPAMFTHDQILSEMIRQVGQGLRQIQIAKELGITAPRVSDMMHGRRRIQQDEMPKLAALLGMSEGGSVPVVGFVGAGGEVVFEDAFEKGDALYDVEIIPGLRKTGLIGLEVRGDSMWPVFRDGYIVFIQRDGWDHVEPDALNDYAVCRVSDGRTLLKEIRPANDGQFDLISQNAPPMGPVSLDWATPVVGSRRRRY